MRSWKTTSAAAATALFSFILFAQVLHMIDFPQWLLAIVMFAHVGGLMSFGVVAKDYNVSGEGPEPHADMAKK